MPKNTEDTVAEESFADLSRYDDMQKKQEEGVDVPILDPAGKDLGFSVCVAGPDSTAQKRAVKILSDERLASESTSPLTDEELEARRVRGLALSTLRWGRFKLDGAEYTFSTDNAEKLYRRFPFIRDQVEARAERRAAFMQP